MRPLRNLVLITLATLILLAIPVPQVGRVWEAVMDLAHPLMFGVLARSALALRRRPLSGAACWQTWLAVSAFGMITEWGQALFGRHPSWSDLVADVSGAGAAISWVWDAPRGARGGAVGPILAFAMASLGVGKPATVFLDELLARQEMPVIASFEHPWQLSRWYVHRGIGRRTRQHATEGQWALESRLTGREWPGPSLTLPAGDWTGHGDLKFDVHFSGPVPWRLYVKIFDWEHDGEFADRFERAYDLQTAAATLTIPLAEIATAPATRRMNLRRIKRFQLYLRELEPPETLTIDHVRLE